MSGIADAQAGRRLDLDDGDVVGVVEVNERDAVEPLRLLCKRNPIALEGTLVDVLDEVALRVLAVADRVAGGDEIVVRAVAATFPADEEGGRRVGARAAFADEGVDRRPDGADGRRQAIGKKALSGEAGERRKRACQKRDEAQQSAISAQPAPAGAHRAPSSPRTNRRSPAMSFEVASGSIPSFSIGSLKRLTQ